MFPVIASDSDASSETAVDCKVDVEVDSPAEVEISRPDNRGRACGGEFGEFCAEVCTKEDGIARNAADISYTHDSSQRDARAYKVMDKRNGTWQVPPNAGATPTLPRIPDRGRTLKLGDAPEPGGTLQ